MFNLLGDQASSSLGDRPFAFDLRHLREDERLEFKYDQSGRLIAVQKIKLTLFHNPIEGRAETDILPGRFGRVFYSGTSWRAKCDEEMKISAGQTVLVIARQDLTLLVLPA